MRLLLMRLFQVQLLLALTLFGRTSEAGQIEAGTSVQFERLANEATHFATNDIIANRWSEERRWPVGLLEEQQGVLRELRAASLDRGALLTLLEDSNPKIRTLALAALFVREDPHDLPLIARLVSDDAPTFPLLTHSLNSMGGRLPLSAFESSQTVGMVASAMIRSYLSAAGRGSSGVMPVASALPSSVFDEYWAERSSRTRCASWFLVKMRRATRSTSPLQPQYEADARRVLEEINALPLAERAWTLLYVRLDQAQLHAIVPDSELVTALEAVGPEALMNFLLLRPFSSDPDLGFVGLRPDDPRSGVFGAMSRLILEHASELLRPIDAEALRANATTDVQLWHGAAPLWLKAADRLQAELNPLRRAAELKVDLARRFANKDPSQPREQVIPAMELWHLRGMVEGPFLVDWFYSLDSHPKIFFLHAVDLEMHADTNALLKALVADRRLESIDWLVMKELLGSASRGLGTPLVDIREILATRPKVPEAWRNILRRHFDLVPDVADPR
jgi:hypothetical protein